MGNLVEIRRSVDTTEVVQIPWCEIRPDSNQPREYFNKGKMDSLRASIAKVGQRTPVKVRPLVIESRGHKYELVDGERRWRVCRDLNINVRAWVEDVDPDEQFLEAVLANFNRADHTPMEICHALERLLNMPMVQRHPKSKQNSELAEIFGHSEWWVINYLNLRRLVPEIRKLLEPGIPKSRRLPIGLAFRLATLPTSEQRRTWVEIKSKKMSATQAQRHVSRTVLKKNLHAHRRGRKPSDDFMIFRRLIKRIEIDIDNIMDLPDFDRMLRGRGKDQCDQIRQDVLGVSESVKRMQERVFGLIGK